MTQKIHIFPLNRIEGDLKIHLELKDGVVTDAWSSGTMYRGFENIMIGRSPMDGLVITPRICGICSTAHLKSASKALDMIYKAGIPDDAKRVRNVTLMLETLQSDIRQVFFLFMSEFANPYYERFPLFQDAVRRYEPLRGESTLQAIRESKKLLEIIAVLGGQWPHSSFMIPGGVTSLPGASHIIQCRHLLRIYRKWYESRVLGCALERWLEVRSRSDLEAWLDASDAHQKSDLGFYIRFSKHAGLEKIGKGHGSFVSFGSLEMPEHTRAANIRNQILGKNLASHGPAHEETFFPSGFSRNATVDAFHQEHITEEVAYSWFNDDERGRHPFDGLTIPYATGSQGGKYSWAKAPRYDGFPAETGPLAEMVIAQHPLFTDLLEKNGPNVFIRELARLVRTAMMIPLLDLWLKEISCSRGALFENYDKAEHGEGFGLIQAARGALGHWVRIKRGKIEKYQIITPTSWNASPRDSDDVRGPWEEAVIGTEVKDADNPVEVAHVIRSYDPCLVCAVHTVRIGNQELFTDARRTIP